MSRSLLAALLCAAAGTLLVTPGTFAEEDTSADREAVAGEWIYEDIDAAYAKSQETGKPLLVAFR